MTGMTAQQWAEATEMLTQLRLHGYQDVESHGAIKPGVRIRHVGARYPEAYTKGTGVVVAVTEKPNSAWSEAYRMPDVEMVVLNDRGDLSALAQYHVEVIGDAS